VEIEYINKLTNIDNNKKLYFCKMWKI
jgi:hypothetical protein